MSKQLFNSWFVVKLRLAYPVLLYPSQHVAVDGVTHVPTLDDATPGTQPTSTWPVAHVTHVALPHRPGEPTAPLAASVQPTTCTFPAHEAHEVTTAFVPELYSVPALHTVEMYETPGVEVRHVVQVPLRPRVVSQPVL